MNSVLNPEAPEFHPLLTNAVQDGFKRVNKTIRTSNGFPAGPSYDIYKTYTAFNIITRQISENVVLQSNQILEAELHDVKLKCTENDENNTEKIIDANDSLLDRVNINIDTLTGVNKPSDQFLQGIKAGKVSAWNNAPIISTIKVGDATFIGAKNIPRPQLSFKDPVDNSHSLWVPKISNKPNNIKPLALNILYNDDDEAVGYEHPYSVELDLYKPPARFVEPDAAPPEFPAPLEATPLTLVDTEAKLDKLVEHLHGCDEIAVDVEHHSYRSYQGITCLIQITTYEGGDFIIDTIAIREHIHKLNDSFTDPKKVKIFHGAYNDVKWLQRDFGVYIVGLFDTFQAGKILQLPSQSLKNLLAQYCQVETNKKYQMADWRIRPLPDELVKYARMDTHYLLYMWRVMKQQLLEMDAGRPTLLLSAFENSRQTCCLTYNKEVMDEMCHMELYACSKKSFNWQQLSALKMLYKWRDAHARELDEGPSYLIPNHMLLNLAEILPREMQGINACCSPMPPFMKLNLLPIHKMILSCRELPAEQTLYEMPSDFSTMLGVAQLPPHLDYRPHDLAYLPEFSEDQINLDLAWAFMDQSVVEMNNVRFDVQPDVQALAPTDANISAGVVSSLNVDAKMFIPPYDRYRFYRTITQADEIKGIKDKEAKVVALSRGNELIKTEVLLQLQAQRDAAEASGKTCAPDQPSTKPDTPTDDQTPGHMNETAIKEEKATKKASQRKRKMEKAALRQPAYVKEEEPQELMNDDLKITINQTPDDNVKETVESAIKEEKATKKASQRKRKMDKAAVMQSADDKKKEPQKILNDDPKVKSFHYKNVNYKKFFSESEKAHKPSKMKFKKP